MRREEKIKGYKEAAEKENQLKSMFLANMSHEIRTPMNAIIGMSELALDFDIEDSKKNTIRQIRSSGIALLNIINDILDFSKIESGKMDIVPADYDLLKMVYDAANVAKVKLEDKDVDLIIEIDPTLSAVYNGDDLRIRQILINLVGNAAKFTEKGFIIIRIEQLNRYEAREGLRFNVIDTGCGIKESDLKNLFEAFRQVDMKINRTKGGTGLGLSISKRLIQLMGGNIGVKSEYQKGSCFYFNIPQKSVSEKTCSEAYRQIFDAASTNRYHSELKNLPLESLLNKTEFASLFAEKTGSFNFICPKAKILIVDDNEVNIQVAQGLLKKFGIVPEVAFSGYEALEKCEKIDFDLIYMDHQMPVMDGVETLKKIREKEMNSNKHSIVIALSANAVNGAKEMFMQNGFNDFVAKPVQGKDFGTSLKKWLSKNLIEENNSAEINESIPAEFQVPDSSMIDINNALCQTGSFENWLKTAKTFDSLIEKKSNLIEEYLAKKDYKNYTIEVHALKSSAKIIGADELSEKAKELEALGNKIQSLFEDIDLIEKMIQEKSAGLLTLYRSYKEVLKAVRSFDENSSAEKTAVSEEKLKEIIESIKNAASKNDLSETEESFNKLKNSILPQEIQKIMPELSEAVENIDFDEILKLL
ncbi:MAG: ATP-binding protein [Treponema sp.]|uniref:ATP-binding protein n=1 Tax=Treponema sp. TaxID=166 RepID=UPI00298DE423|nr:ATP-binding protein [Treponema sp.]MCQ2601823.1 ATP-binding protein [Treponema sp.]